LNDQFSKEIIKDIESDFAKLRKAEMQKRNNTNKSRSKSQERAVAKFLGASRVPMSGSGMLKGDGIWNSPKGLIIYECKYSSVHHAIFGHTLRIQYHWIPKLESDAASMKASLYFLIVHFYNQIGGVRWGTCFIREELIAPLMLPEWLEGAFEYEHSDQRAAVRVYYREIRNLYKLNKAFPCGWLLTPHGKHVILPLWALKQLIVEDSYDSSGIASS
jgi:hypothetical protein